MGCGKIEPREDSKQSGVFFNSDGSKFYKYFKKKLSFRVHLKKSQSSGISCVSVRRNNSQGCTADVKETPPSPEEKQEDLIDSDIDPVEDDEDLVKSIYSLMAKGSMESFDSGVSFKSDQSIEGLIHFNDSFSLSRSDLSSFEKKHDVADDEDLVKSLDDLMLLENRKPFDFSVSFKSYQSKNRQILIKHRSLAEGRDDPGALF